MLDLLQRYPSCQLTFASYLQMLAPLTPRQYSISSSPRWSSDHATLTLAVLSAPALSGDGIYEGAASTYLAHARPGSKVAVTVRPSNVAFHPPASLQTPIVLACAGSGLAPFRGFLQDRALAAQEAGERPAPALLFFGCDAPDVDYLYSDELAAWAEQGVVDVRPAFSAAPVDGVRYVQDRIWADREDVRRLIKDGGTFFVCGDGRRMAPAVFETCARIYAEVSGATAGGGRGLADRDAAATRPLRGRRLRLTSGQYGVSGSVAVQSRRRRGVALWSRAVRRALGPGAAGRCWPDARPSRIPARRSPVPAAAAAVAAAGAAAVRPGRAAGGRAAARDAGRHRPAQRVRGRRRRDARRAGPGGHARWCTCRTPSRVTSG